MTTSVSLQSFVEGFAQRLRDEAELAGRRGELTAAITLRQVAQDLEVAAADPSPTPAGPLHVTEVIQ